MAYANGSDPEAANFPGDSANDWPWQERFCSNLGFWYWTRQLPVWTLLQRKSFFGTFAVASRRQPWLLSRTALPHCLPSAEFLFFLGEKSLQTAILISLSLLPVVPRTHLFCTASDTAEDLQETSL
jgi:hypothetical protein